MSKKKVEFKSVAYEPSDSIELQGNYEKTKPYRKRGYYTKIQRNGYWVLVKPAGVSIRVKKNDSQKLISFDGRDVILDYYNRQRITPKLIKKFEKEAESGKIKFYLDDNEVIIE